MLKMFTHANTTQVALADNEYNGALLHMTSDSAWFGGWVDKLVNEMVQVGPMMKELLEQPGFLQQFEDEDALLGFIEDELEIECDDRFRYQCVTTFACALVKEAWNNVPRR